MLFFFKNVGASEFRGVKIVDSEIILPYQLTNTHRLVFFFSDHREQKEGRYIDSSTLVSGSLK